LATTKGQMSGPWRAKLADQGFDEAASHSDLLGLRFLTWQMCQRRGRCDIKDPLRRTVTERLGPASNNLRGMATKYGPLFFREFGGFEDKKSLVFPWLKPGRSRCLND
jgi:hypothetical protein